MSIIDLSNNGLTGSLPDEIFTFPALTSLSLGKNCFRGTIPNSICSASSLLQTLALDGLATSDACSESIWNPFGLFNSRFGGLMEGSIPDCVWSLPSLQVLHMAGNRLTGSLPGFTSCSSSATGTCGLSPSLQDVGLTHNLLKGTIPNAFQHFSFDNLDLSYNKLRGSIQNMNNLSLSYESGGFGASVDLENNRLTGILPNSFIEAYNIQVLGGNMFGCNQDGRNDLAKHDPNYSNSICGSEELNGALASFGVFVALACFLGGLLFIRKFTSKSKKMIKRIWISILYNVEYIDKAYRILINPEEGSIQYPNIYKFLVCLSFIRRISLVIATYAMVVCLPIYLIFYEADHGRFSTHQEQYTWIISSAFLTGEPPAIVIMFLWTLVIALFIYLTVSFRLKFDKVNDSTATDEDLVSDMDADFDSYKAQELRSFASSSNLSSSPVTHHSWHPESFDVNSAVEPPHSEGNNNTRQIVLSLPGDTIPPVHDRDSSSSTIRNGGSFASSVSMDPLQGSSEMFAKLRKRARKSLVFLVNTIFVIGINVGYLALQNSDAISSNTKIAFQVLMAGFKLFWNFFVVRSFLAFLSRHRQPIDLHVSMLAFNNIIAPCIATAFTDSSCFQELFVASSAIQTSYNVTTCIESIEYINTTTSVIQTICTQYQTQTFTTSFTPSFIYYYTCGSKLLTVYTPVFFYSYTFLIIAVPIILLTFCFISREKIPNFLLVYVDGVLRPQDKGQFKFDKLAQTNTMQSTMFSHVIVLLTFGLATPLLGLFISLYLLENTMMWQMILIRYVQYGTWSSPLSVLYDRDSNSESDSSDNTGVGASKALNIELGISQSENVSIGNNRLENQSEVLSPMSEVNDINPKSEAKMAPPRGVSVNQAHAAQVEASRWHELDKICGDAWLGPVKVRRQLVYISILFYVGVFFDMVGDEGGWKVGMWVVASGLGFLLVLRIGSYLLKQFGDPLHLFR